MAGETIFETRARRPFSGGAWMVALGTLVIATLSVGAWFWYRSTSAQSAETLNSEIEIKSVLHLENFVVNLSGASGNGYLRVGIDLGLSVELKDNDARKAYVARVRDAILGVLGSRSVEELLTPGGKAKLKGDLLGMLRERVPEIRCHEIYFTEFLVQH
jgi:flagellar protein FliL